jgi:hypothetical protein
MTGGEQWSEQGLGESGETYLVGPDFTMRSASRFFSENPERYLKSLEGLGYPAQKLAQLRRYKTSILNQNVNTDAALYALAGERGTRIIEDYRKVAVLSSYGPLDFGEARWAVIAELDTKEAFAPVRALQQVISIWAIADFSSGCGFGNMGSADHHTTHRSPDRRCQGCRQRRYP